MNACSDSVQAEAYKIETQMKRSIEKHWNDGCRFFSHLYI